MIYISLTTVQTRLNERESILRNLNSLINQRTDKAFKVCLSVPLQNRKGEDIIVPDYVMDIDAPNFEVNRVMDDIGPINKILDVLPFSNTGDILIICDDDHEYHLDMLEYHLKKRAQYPDKIICFRGDIPLDKREWEGKYAYFKTHYYFPVQHDRYIAVPGHWHSVSYNREFFGSDFNKEALFIKECVNDDMIVAYYAKKNKIDIICAVWDKETDFRPVNDHGRGAWSFPIVQPLPYPSSGFDEHRKEASDGYGTCGSSVMDFIHNNDEIYG